MRQREHRNTKLPPADWGSYIAHQLSKWSKPPQLFQEPEQEVGSDRLQHLSQGQSWINHSPVSHWDPLSFINTVIKSPIMRSEEQLSVILQLKSFQNTKNKKTNPVFQSRHVEFHAFPQQSLTHCDTTGIWLLTTLLSTPVLSCGRHH